MFYSHSQPMRTQVSLMTKIGRKVKRVFLKSPSQTQLMPTISHGSTSSNGSKSNDSQHEQKNEPSATPMIKSTLPDGMEFHPLSYESPMDRAIKKHLSNCTLGAKCPCGALDIDNLDQGLHEIEATTEMNKPRIREKLHKLLPSLKAMEPWVEIIDTVAQVNPISGQVSGLVKVAIKIAIVIGDQYNDVVSSLQHVREILCLLALYEKDEPPPDLVEDIFQAYLNVFDFLCIESNHKRARKETDDRLTKSVQCLESKATPVILNIISRLAKLQTLAEMELKEDECMREIHDTGTPNEESVDIRNPAENTCDWVYDRSDCEYLQPWRDWRDSEDSSIMLLTGGIGTGKSTLALSAINALRNSPSPQYRLVSASFCKYQVNYNHCEAILRGLLYGIVRDDREARKILVHYRDNFNNGKVGRGLNAFKNFESLSDCFTSCIQSRPKELCLVVDGLDECEEVSRRKLLKYLVKLVDDAKINASLPPLKVLLLSRPINTITISLPSSYKLDLHEVRKSDETRRIIEHLVETSQFQQDDTLRARLVLMLQEKADGCIQWVTVVVEHLSQFGVNTLDNIERELRELSDCPNDLDGLYLTLFGRHFDKSSMEYANTALRLVAGAARPLSIDELANAMIVNPLRRSKISSKEDFKNEAQAYRVPRLEPFVRIVGRSSKIIMHASLKELISRTPHLGVPSNLPYVENPIPKLALSNLLAMTCLDFLLLPYFQNKHIGKDFNLDQEDLDWLMGIQIGLNGNEDLQPENDENQEPKKKEVVAFFTYAAEHWAHHLSDTDFSEALIAKSTKLSEEGSVQCINWWEQYNHGSIEREPEHMSPFLTAIYFGHEPIIKTLMQDALQKQNLNLCQDNAVYSAPENLITGEALALAVRMASFDTFELLYNAAPDDEIKENGYRLLLTAMRRRRKDVFEMLINDPRVEPKYQVSTPSGPRDRTILREISIRGDVESLNSLLGLLQTKRRNEIIALLHGDYDDEQCSPLWHAVFWRHTEFVEVICSLDPDIIRHQLLCPGKFDVHIVATAAKTGDQRIMAALLNICPEYVDRRCSGEDTPLNMTHWNEDGEAARIAEFLLATGLVDIESTDEFGYTPLMRAFTHSKLELCKVLIRNGADISKIIRISEHDEPTCLVSTGFPWKDIKMRDAILGLNYAVK